MENEQQTLEEIESMQPRADRISTAPEGSRLISGELTGGLFRTIIRIFRNIFTNVTDVKDIAESKIEFLEYTKDGYKLIAKK